MTTLFRAAILFISSLAFTTAHAAIAAEPQAPKDLSDEGAQIVGKHAIVMNAPVGGPSTGMANGPIIGNGDLGVMQSGPAEHLIFYIGKNDFWCIRTQSVMAVGQVRIAAPALQGASFKTTVDMQLAEIRGEYAKGDAALASRAWVDANRNFLCIELVNKGTHPLAMTVQNTKGGDGAMKPTRVKDNDTPIQVGCEQYGGGRWFFSGEMADVKVLDRALSEEEIAKLAQGERKEVRAFDGKTRQPLAAPAISRALTVYGWIKASKRSREADYIISKGEWNQAYSLGLSKGHVRFAIGGFFLQCDEQVPRDRWVHVAAIFDSKHMAVLVDGKVKTSAEAAADLGAAFLYAPDAPNPAGRRIGLVTRVVGNTDAREFTLEPGKTAVVATAILSDLDVKGQDPLGESKLLAAALTLDKLAEHAAAHRQWWRNFWSRSFIEIPDKVIEQHWYSSWYTVGSCSREGKVAPGLWGNWITTDTPAWHGDFHLNYNFQAPFYGLYSANHPESALPFYDAMSQSIPRGQRIAREHGWKGIHLPVSIGPWGMCPEGDKADWGQRSNTAYSALPFIWHWQYTQDKEWLKNTGYTYLRETALFWEDYLKFEHGRYMIYNDSIHEGSGPDMNGLLSLGLVRTLFKNMIPMSEVLGVDADKRAKWKDICENISPFPTQERNGKTVFRYTEKGTAWWNDNTLGIQHIFPAGAIGLDSDPKLLEISRNMIDVMQRWTDGNGFSSWYSACARVGYDPKRILAGLRHECDTRSAPNRLLQYGGGGIENCSGFLAVNEMLLQSHGGVIRLFPCWPREMDARFGTLRAVGAFLVSADLKGGVISGVKISSEKGRACTVVNPWPDKKVQVIRNGKNAETVAGDRFTLETSVNETLELGAGTFPGAAAETDSLPARGGRRFCASLIPRRPGSGRS